MTTCNNIQSPNQSRKSKIFTRRYFREQPPPLENISVHGSTPWPKAGKMSGNLFKLRKDWSIPPTNNTTTATIPKPPIKIEPQAQEQPTISSTVAPKAEKCGCG